ncbi:hypothetical protein D3C83_133580 [compost metagenome]
MRSVMSGPAPLYGTCTMFTLASEKKRYEGSTLPALPRSSCPGRARASATNCCGLFAGSDGCAMIICGETVRSVTGTRSFSGS